MVALPVPILFTLYVLAGMLVAAPLVMLVTRLSPAQAGWRPGGWPTLALGLGWGVLLAAGLVSWLRLLLDTGNYLPIPTVVTRTDWLLLALAAPVAEEIFLRGALFGGLQRRWSPFWAVTLSAGADVVIHYAQPWIAVHFVVAAAYALTFRMAGSVFASMLAHTLAVSALLGARAHPATVADLSWHALLAAAIGALALILAGGLGRRAHS